MMLEQELQPEAGALEPLGPLAPGGPEQVAAGGSIWEEQPAEMQGVP